MFVVDDLWELAVYTAALLAESRRDDWHDGLSRW